MAKRIALAFAGIIFGASASAQESSPAYRNAAMEISYAIQSGDKLTTVDGVFGLSRLEYAELSRLAGCDPAFSEEQKDVAVITWSCGPSTSQPGLERVITMHFEDDDRLHGLAINPLVANFAPTEVALNMESKVSADAIAQRFGDAVVSGGDPTLDRIIPLGNFQLSRLAYFAGGKFRVRSQDEGVLRLSFRDVRGERRETYLHFDEQGRPIGLIFDATFCSYCAVTDRREETGVRERSSRDRNDEARRRLRKSEGARDAADNRRRTRRLCPTC